MITKFLLRDRLTTTTAGRDLSDEKLSLVSGAKGQKSDGKALEFLKITMKHEGMSSPERAHVFACKVGADTKEDLVRELRWLAEQIARDELTAGVSGGYGAGAIYAYRHDPAMTHERYFAELEEHLERLKQETRSQEPGKAQ